MTRKFFFYIFYINIYLSSPHLSLTLSLALQGLYHFIFMVNLSLQIKLPSEIDDLESEGNKLKLNSRTSLDDLEMIVIIAYSSAFFLGFLFIQQNILFHLFKHFFQIQKQFFVSFFFISILFSLHFFS